MYTVNSSVIEKLTGLLFFLKRSKKEFEMVADEMENHSLRTALNGLSDESNNFAVEIKNYLKSLGLYQPANDLLQDQMILTESPSLDENAGKGDEVLTICNYNEHFLTNAYSELLEESLPFQWLKDIMIYQLNALKNAFMKIKTLNRARFELYNLQHG